MEKETLEEAAEIFVNNRFTKQICGDESYPDILASKSSIVESHILFAKWQQEQYTSAHTILEYILLNDDGVGIALGYNSREMIEHYFKRINYDIVS